jgi:hypothetical protein
MEPFAVMAEHQKAQAATAGDNDSFAALENLRRARWSHGNDDAANRGYGTWDPSTGDLNIGR